MYDPRAGNPRRYALEAAALVAQWIEHAPPKRGMQVRFLPGACGAGPGADSAGSSPGGELPGHADSAGGRLSALTSGAPWRGLPCYRPPFLVSESTLEAPPVAESAIP